VIWSFIAANIIIFSKGVLKVFNFFNKFIAAKYGVGNLRLNLASWIYCSF
jgi:hypothetical protein